MFCDHCGAQLREDAEFCHVCGAKQLTFPADGAAAAPTAPQPERVPEKEPEKGPARGPEPAPDRAPEKERETERAPEKAPEKEPEAGPAPAGQAEGPALQPAQPLCGTFTWENVKISGEFQNGTGTLTITFS